MLGSPYGGAVTAFAVTERALSAPLRGHLSQRERQAWLPIVGVLAKADRTMWMSKADKHIQNSPASYIIADSAHSGAVSQRRIRLPRVQTCKPASLAWATSDSSRPPSGPVSRLTVL